MDWSGIIDVMRWIVLSLCLSGIALMWRGAARAAAGDVSASDGFKLANVGILLSVIGFQSGYLFEGVPEQPHWRIAANLLGLLVSLFVLLAVVGVLQAETEVRTGKASRMLCIWRWARVKICGKQ